MPPAARSALRSGQLIAVGLLALFGLHGIVLMVLPGTLIAGWLLYEMRTISVLGRARHGARMEEVAPIPKLALAAVIMVMMARSWMMSEHPGLRADLVQVPGLLGTVLRRAGDDDHAGQRLRHARLRLAGRPASAAAR